MVQAILCKSTQVIELEPFFIRVCDRFIPTFFLTYAVDALSLSFTRLFCCRWILKKVDWKVLVKGVCWSFTLFLTTPIVVAQEPNPEGKAREVEVQEVETKNGDRSSEEGAIAEKKAPTLVPYWKKGANWLEGSRDVLSDRVNWMARGIDRFFAGDETLAFSNKSYVRLRTGGAWVEGHGFVDDTDIKFRLHLPATKRRFNIVIETESGESESLEEKTRPSLLQSSSVDESRLTAALEFARAEAKLWKTKTLLGVKARIPADLFLRFTAKRRWILNELWTMPYRFKAEERLKDEWEIENSLAFERPLDNDLYFSARSSIEWEEDEVTVAAQTFGVRQKLSERRAIDYRTGIIGKDVAKPRVTSYFVSAHYRELLYKDWLYWNLIPEVNFPKDEGFDPTFSFTIRFEMFLQK